MIVQTTGNGMASAGCNQCGCLSSMSIAQRVQSAGYGMASVRCNWCGCYTGTVPVACSSILLYWMKHNARLEGSVKSVMKIQAL